MSNLRGNDRSEISVKLPVKTQQTESKKTEPGKQKGRSFYAAAFVYNDYSTNQQIPPSNAQ